VADTPGSTCGMALDRCESTLGDRADKVGGRDAFDFSGTADDVDTSGAADNDSAAAAAAAAATISDTSAAAAAVSSVSAPLYRYLLGEGTASGAADSAVRSVDASAAGEAAAAGAGAFASASLSLRSMPCTLARGSLHIVRPSLEWMSLLVRSSWIWCGDKSCSSSD